MYRLPLVLSALLLVGSSARADQVHLVEGRILEGAATIVGDKVVIELEGGRITVPLREVAKIERQASPLSEAIAKAAALKANDVAGLLRVADFCREHDLLNKERELLQRILVVAPDHLDARRRLGFARATVNGHEEWVDRAEVARREQADRRQERQARAELEQKQAELSLAEARLARTRRELRDSERERDAAREVARRPGVYVEPTYYGGAVYSGVYGAYGLPVVVGPLSPPSSSGPVFHIPGVRHPGDPSFSLPGVRPPAAYFDGAFRR
jgi:hypothetical protein